MVTFHAKNFSKKIEPVQLLENAPVPSVLLLPILTPIEIHLKDFNIDLKSEEKQFNILAVTGFQ